MSPHRTPYSTLSIPPSTTTSPCPIRPATTPVSLIINRLLLLMLYPIYSIGTMIALRDIARASLDVVEFDELVDRGNQPLPLVFYYSYLTLH